MPDRSFRGVWIPAEIYEDMVFSWTEKILLVELDSLSREECCWASNQYFARFLGVTTGHVANMLARLEKAGLIQRLTEGSHRRIRVMRLAGFKKRPALPKGGSGRKAAQGAAQAKNAPLGPAQAIRRSNSGGDSTGRGPEGETGQG